MHTRFFIGKAVSLSMVQKDSSVSFYNKGEYDDDYSVAELDLNNFECLGNTDRTGRNAYSIQLFLDGDKIKKIQRIGHCHMCSGQGSDDELRRFPQMSLEEEAEQKITNLLV